MVDAPHLTSAWDDYRNRRRWFFGVWIGGFLLLGALIKLFGNVIFVLAPVWMLAFVVVAWRLSAFRCPRCGRLFFSTWIQGDLFAQRCLHCGLSKWEASERQDESQQTSEGSGPIDT